MALEWDDDLPAPPPPPALFERLRSSLGEDHARELADELYGLGLYIAPLKEFRDPFDRVKAPLGMSYQWVFAGAASEAESNGWVTVSSTRHEGMFAPIGYDGPIAMRGLMLMERDAAITNAVRAVEINKAHKQVDDWVAKYGGMFSGHIKVGTSEESAETRMLGDPVIAREVVASTRLPPSVDPSAMFAARDRLRTLAAECGDIMPTPAAITSRAIELSQEAA